MPYLNKDCLHCGERLYSVSSKNKSRNEVIRRNEVKKYCNGQCAQKHRTNLAREDLKKECVVCKDWYGIKRYTNGNKETPSSFEKRQTCGKEACRTTLRLQHWGDKRNAERELSKMDIWMDRFIYARDPIENYQDYMR